MIEVVKEDLAIKKKVLGEAAKHRRPGSVISTNTSGILVRSMADGMDDDMRRHFLGTHFFNPPRYLKLLEIIPGPDTLPGVVATLKRFAEDVLGKGIVVAKDTPNFVANRILTYACQFIMREFPKDGLSVDDVDSLRGDQDRVAAWGVLEALVGAWRESDVRADSRGPALTVLASCRDLTLPRQLLHGIPVVELTLPARSGEPEVPRRSGQKAPSGAAPNMLRTSPLQPV